MMSSSVPQSQSLFQPSHQRWKPLAYMLNAVTFLLEHACGGLFLDPGLGKTAITLAAIKVMMKKGLVKKVLVIAPLRPCYLVWPKERMKWTDFHGLKMVILHGPNKDQALKEKADIYVINPEGLDWLTQVQKSRTPFGKVKVSIDLARWKRLGFDTLIVDELSKFKHTNTNRFKMLKLILPLFGRRWGLTGSPAANGLLDLFGQCYVLDQGRSLGQFITHYRAQYFQPVDKEGWDWQLQAGADKKIYARISPLVLRMAGEDYLQMPELVSNTIKITLPPSVRKIYDRLENDLIAQIEHHTVVASSAAVASIKCRQIVNGGIYLTPELGLVAPHDQEWVNLHTEKVDALADLIDELQGAPLLVAYDFAHDLDRIRKKFGKDVPYIGGGISTKRAQDLESLWNQGKLPVLFGHPQSMAHGLNLQEQACHVAWHSLTWNFELYDQFIRRVRRQGNTAPRVFCHHIIADDTIDEVILSALRSKNRDQQALFDGLKALAAQRRTKL